MSGEAVDNSAGESPAVSKRLSDRQLLGALRSTLTSPSSTSDLADVARTIVDSLVTELELAQARLFAIAGDVAPHGRAHLEPIAAAGSHAVLLRDLPSVPLGESNDIARVGSSGEPEYHGDVHGLGEEPKGGHVGLGRWRAAVSAQSSAVLPLTIGGRAIGVLALDWSAPRAFSDSERQGLEAIATAVALIVDSILTSERSSLPQTPAAGCTPSSTAELAVTTEGLVVPTNIPGAWASSLALDLRVGASAPETEIEEVFWDVVGLHTKAVVLSLGLVLVPQGSASEVAETARHMLRASALQGAGPAHGLGLLSGWLGASGRSSAWISALMLRIDLAQSLATWCSAGSAAFAIRYRDGRLRMDSASYPPLGSTTTPGLVDEDALILPGDRIVLATGQIGELKAMTGQTRLATALADSGQLDQVLDLLHTSSDSGGAIVGEVGPSE